ncbi:hypothetical protein GOP47_0021051 [Adiantum capillus-veneris]|uniref:Uncharacterized protein n=1 Tax=Adiantum capillus-veneris TaxID=13818 RepID=A0A9D4UC66_ADICA|nr:hypothetical protein GOP47_0021051 [Adiantum capillus-veneris]
MHHCTMSSGRSSTKRAYLLCAIFSEGRRPLHAPPSLVGAGQKGTRPARRSTKKGVVDWVK